MSFAASCTSGQYGGIPVLEARGDNYWCIQVGLMCIWSEDAAQTEVFRAAVRGTAGCRAEYCPICGYYHCFFPPQIYV